MYTHKDVPPRNTRSQTHGNPRFYSTFLDESLNLTLRNVASAAHRTNMENRIFRLMALQADLGLQRYLYGTAG